MSRVSIMLPRDENFLQKLTSLSAAKGISICLPLFAHKTFNYNALQCTMRARQQGTDIIWKVLALTVSKISDIVFYTHTYRRIQMDRNIITEAELLT